MRTLSGSLTAAQQSPAIPYVGVNLVKAGSGTYTFTTADATNRIWSIQHVESIWGSTSRTIIRLQNHDQYFSAKDLRGYKVYCWFGYVTGGGNEYSETAEQWVEDQREVSEEGVLLTELVCVDIWWRFGKLKVVGGGVKLSGTPGAFQLAESVTEQTDPGGVPTGVTAEKILSIATDHIVVTGMAGGTFGVGNKVVGDTSFAEMSITAVSVGGAGAAPAWQADTTILNIISSLMVDVADVVDDTAGADAQLATMPTYIADRMDPIIGVLRRMMEQTFSGLVFKNDGDVHVVYIDPAGAVTYTYDSAHSFFVHVRSRRLTIPNKVFVVDVLPDNEGATYTYWGVADDTTSQDAIGIVTAIFEDPALTSDEEAATKALAFLTRIQDETTQGVALAPMNCGQEVLDKITITDTRANISLTGRIGIIIRQYNPRSTDRTQHYTIECRIGGLTDMVDISSPQSMIESLLTYGYGRLGVPGGAITGPIFSPSVTIDASQVNFAPAVLTDWDSDTDPGQADDALDQLAERTDDLEAATHAAVTLAADADTLLGLSGQELSLDGQAANLVLAGPTSGAAADPTFRSLVVDDIPQTNRNLISNPSFETDLVGWSDYSTVTRTQSDDWSKYGRYSQKVVTGGGANQGCIWSLTPSDVAGRTVTASCWVYRDEDVVTLRLFIGWNDGSWHFAYTDIPKSVGEHHVSVSTDIGAGATTARISVEASTAGACTFYVDGAQVVDGSSEGLYLELADIDHGYLKGLADDDHTQYLLASGVRAGSTSQAQDFGATGIKADAIAESTAAAGVSIDGVLLKDSLVGAAYLGEHDYTRHTNRTRHYPVYKDAFVTITGTPTLARDTHGSLFVNHIDFTAQVDERLSWTLPPLPSDYVTGTLILKWHWSSDAAGGDVHFTIRLRESGDGDTSHTQLNSTVVYTIAAPAVANTIKESSLTTSGNYTAGKHIEIEFAHTGADVADTNDGQISLFAIWLEYTGDM